MQPTEVYLRFSQPVPGIPRFKSIGIVNRFLLNFEHYLNPKTLGEGFCVKVSGRILFSHVDEYLVIFTKLRIIVLAEAK